jgi:molybdopterin converting factor small subunit
MKVKALFHSYFKELAGCAEWTGEVPEGATITQLVETLHQLFPRLESMKRSTLIAVGVDYQPGEYQLREGDEVSLFPPVQGG